MKIGVVINETWEFFHEIFEDLNQHHHVSVFNQRTTKWPIFRERKNRNLFRKDLQEFMHKNDVLFFEWASELLVRATQFPKICPIITRLHRYEMYQWADQVNWDKVDKIILVSQSKEDEFLNRFPDQIGKTVVISPGVSLEKFSFQPKKFRGDIGILCYISPRKRVYDLILSFYELSLKKKDFHLHIGGAPQPLHDDYMVAINHIVETLKIDNQVTFYGAVENSIEWFRLIDIFVSNSYSEGLQVAQLEAMATGCYCLSHWWAGADEMLPQEYLYYTSAELQQKLIRCCDLSDEEFNLRRKQLHNIAIDKFDIEITKTSIRQVVEEVAGGFN